MQHATTFGVPVFWCDDPGPLRAGLVFGVGRRDESFVLGGITHLVEHLVMRAARPRGVEANASVDLSTTEFAAAGRPERVADFLRRCCEALNDLPVDALQTEASVLAVEGGAATDPMVAFLLGEAYGGRGVGLAAFVEPAIHKIAATDVLAWVSRYFTRANAAVWAVGPREGLALPLPSGERPARAPQVVRERPLPGWCHHDLGSHIGIAARLQRTPGAIAAFSVVRERLEEELRYRRGLSYMVAAENVVIDARERFLTMTVDARKGSEAAAVDIAWDVLGRLASDGPTSAEIDAERAAFDDSLDGPDASWEQARSAAVSHVLGHDPFDPDRVRAELDALTTDDVRLGADNIRNGAIIAVPEAVEIELPGVAPPPAASSATPVSGRSFRPRLRASLPRRTRLLIGDEGVSIVPPRRTPITVRYADVIGLLQTGREEYELVSADGSSINLRASDWHEGTAVLATVCAAIPPDLRMRIDER